MAISHSTNRLSGVRLIVALFAALICLPVMAAAQDDPPYDIAPPPLKFVVKDEQARLDAEIRPKDRTKLAVTLMDARMIEAEKQNTAEQFDHMFTELGHFAGLLDYTLSYLGKQDPNDKKTLDNYKRLEISLRGFVSRLEVIRRDLPIRYEKYVRDLSSYLRNARSRALDPQFSNTVVPGA